MRISKLKLAEVGPFKELSLEFSLGTDPERADTVVLVGPNGSGKSTILYAIAGCLSNSDELGQRFRSIVSSASLSLDIGEEREVEAFTLAIGQPTVDVPVHAILSGKQYSVAVPSALMNQSPNGDITGRTARAPLVFAYSGTRTSSTSFEVATSPPVPLDFALHFDKPYGFAALTDWVGDVMGRRDSAIVAGELEKAHEVSEGLRRMEELLQTITKIPTTVFSRNFDTGVIELTDGSTPVALHLLPEGLKSILSWVGDLLRRMYQFKTGGVPHHELPIVLLLDEIDVHLHPRWQRLVLPALERLLPKAQIFLTTHSPFVVMSATDAQIVWLQEGGVVREDIRTESLRGFDYTSVLELMGVEDLQDQETVEILHQLDRVVEEIGAGTKNLDDFDKIAALLPDAPDLEVTVDFQRSQAKRLAKSR